MPTRRTNVKGKKTTRKVETVVPFKVPSPRLSRYIYVEARGWFIEAITDIGTVQVLDGAISFAECIVRAQDVGHAYQLGAAAMDTLKVEDPNHGGNHFTGTFLNDYVVKL